jgi:tRNA(fMet)-specific endonuclease VapC
VIYVLDTNTVTFILKEDKDVRQNADIALSAGHELTIPKIVDYELQRGLVAKRMDKKLREYLAFRDTMDIGAIDDDVWHKAIHVYASLRQKGTPIGDGDILIAAYCLVHDYTLVTHDTEDFGRVDGLKFVDWKKSTA